MNEQFKNRLKSFAWRLGAVVVVAILSEISNEVTTLGLSGPSVVIVGLIIGEVTKFLNTEYKK